MHDVRVDCRICGAPIDNYAFDKFGGLCSKCSQETNLSQERIQSFEDLCRNKQPFILKSENGACLFAFHLPVMSEIVDQDSEISHLHVDFGKLAGLKQAGELVGMAGFYYNANYYWEASPERLMEAFKWFGDQIHANSSFWMAIEQDTVRDFLENNWRPSNQHFKEILTFNIISLTYDLYCLSSMNVELKGKLAELRRQMKSYVRSFQKLSSDIVFSQNYKFPTQALKGLTDLRDYLSHLSAESRLARISRIFCLDVKMSVHPDLIIGKRSVEVKTPAETYILPERHGPFTPLTNESTKIENLTNVIADGLRQNPDIIAIEVNHLDKREINGFNSKWLGSMSLEEALHVAINYHKKGVVLLFKTGSSGMTGRILIVSKVDGN